MRPQHRRCVSPRLPARSHGAIGHGVQWVGARRRRRVPHPPVRFEGGRGRRPQSPEMAAMAIKLDVIEPMDNGTLGAVYADGTTGWPTPRVRRRHRWARPEAEGRLLGRCRGRSPSATDGLRLEGAALQGQSPPRQPPGRQKTGNAQRGAAGDGPRRTSSRPGPPTVDGTAIVRAWCCG